MHLGEEIGRGVRSVVYALGEHDVAKVPNADVPPDWLVEEHRLTNAAARCGAPVPGRRRLVDVDGVRALATERVAGRSMLEEAVQQPARARELGAELARIQVDLASIVPSFELPAQRDRIISKVHVAAAVHGIDLLAVLDRMPIAGGPLVLCHGDLHPRNVLLASDGEVLVDWFDASRGSLTAEVARTILMLEDIPLLDALIGIDSTAVMPEIGIGYRASFLALSELDRDELDAWLLIQSVARLAEGFGADRLDRLRRQIDV